MSSYLFGPAFGLVSILLVTAIVVDTMSRRTKRRITCWWLRRTRRDRRPKPEMRIVVDASGYRSGPARVEIVEPKPDHTMLWTVVLVIVGVLGVFALFRI